jgi:hypothetical protein
MVVRVQSKLVKELKTNMNRFWGVRVAQNLLLCAVFYELLFYLSLCFYSFWTSYLLGYNCFIHGCPEIDPRSYKKIETF